MLETFELLDRFELLYPTNAKLADLRRSYIDKDMSSIFRLTDADEELRKAIIEENLHSIFRIVNNYDIEDLRKAVIEKNLHSIFRLCDDEDLRKLILEDNIWKLWPILERYKQTQFIWAFKEFFVNDLKIDKDCFSRGQLKSKLWVVKELKKLDLDLGTVFLCAGWYGTLSTMLFESNIKIEKIRSFDKDPSCRKIAEIFNKPWVKNDWAFKSSTQDILEIDYNQHSYNVTRSDNSLCELTDSPDTIINTSCEHIEDFSKWYNSIPDGKLVILQSNDYFDIEEHVNCSKSISQFSKSCPMKETLFEGELFLPEYTRFMKIGFR
jgi:hypothetical protein